MKEALRRKSLVAKHKLGAQTLIEKIQKSTCQAWKWARNEENVGELKAALLLLEKSMTPIHRDLIVMDAKTVKKSMSSASHFDIEVAKFVALRPLVDEVASTTSSLLAMHVQRQRNKGTL